MVEDVLVRGEKEARMVPLAVLILVVVEDVLVLLANLKASAQ